MSEFFVDAAGGIRSSSDEKHAAEGRIYFGQNKVSWLQPFRAEALDVIRVATAVYQVDRIAPRPRGGLDAQRAINLECEVSRPDLWEPQTTLLGKLLNWMTDDCWKVTFSLAKARLPQQKDFFPAESISSGSCVALYSGGLDSQAGTFLASRQGRRIYSVTCLGNDVRDAFVQTAHATIRRLEGDSQLVRFDHRLYRAGHYDPLMRARAFLFWSAGVAVADALNVSEVDSYECGPGALNLPMNAAQVGSQNTRAMHPRTLMFLESLFTAVLGRPIRLRLPWLEMTKGQLCVAVGDALGEVARSSNSCDQGERGKKREDWARHCGFCTSCLYRRAGLFAALGADDPTEYAEVETARTGNYDLNAFVHQARELLRFATYNDVLQFEPSARHFVSYLVACGAGRPAAERSLVTVLQRHADEALRWRQAMQPQIRAQKPQRSQCAEEESGDLFRKTR